MPGADLNLFCCGIAIAQLRQQCTAFKCCLLKLHMVSWLKPAFKWGPRKRGWGRDFSSSQWRTICCFVVWFFLYMAKSSCWILGNKMIEWYPEYNQHLVKVDFFFLPGSISVSSISTASYPASWTWSRSSSQTTRQALNVFGFSSSFLEIVMLELA